MRRRVMLVGLFLLATGGLVQVSAASTKPDSECPIGSPAPYIRTEHLADGGHIHHYAVDGETLVPEPPTDFVPLQASDERLARYGFPPRPVDPTERAVWAAEMSAWQPVPHKGLCVTDRVFGRSGRATDSYETLSPPEMGQDFPWSGYLDDQTVDTYIAVQGDYNQKPYGSTACAGAEMGAWVGFGGYNSYSLIQTGTAMYKSGGTPVYFAWYEYLDETHLNPAVVMPNVDVSPGDSIHLYTVHQRSTGQTTFYVADNTSQTQQSVIKTLASSYYDGTSVQHIAEAPLGHKLANFGNLNWTNTKVQLLSGNWVSLGSRSPTELRSKDYYTDQSFHTTADPDPMSSNTSFTDRWLRCD